MSNNSVDGKQIILVGGGDDKNRFDVARSARNLLSGECIIVNSSLYMKEFKEYALGLYGDTHGNELSHNFLHLVQEPLCNQFLSIIKNMYETLNISIIAIAPFEVIFSNEDHLLKFKNFTNIHHLELKFIYIKHRLLSNNSTVTNRQIQKIYKNSSIHKISPLVIHGNICVDVKGSSTLRNMFQKKINFKYFSTNNVSKKA